LQKYTDLFTGRNKITKTVDPWAGLLRGPREIADHGKLEEVEELGGMTKAIEAG
jgi:hypothetical protein